MSFLLKLSDGSVQNLDLVGQGLNLVNCSLELSGRSLLGIEAVVLKHILHHVEEEGQVHLCWVLVLVVVEGVEMVREICTVLQEEVVQSEEHLL